MDERLARIVIGNAIRASREIGGLAPLLNEHAAPDAYEELKDGIGSVVFDVHHLIMRPVFIRFPALRVEFEENLQEYGLGA